MTGSASRGKEALAKHFTGFLKGEEPWHSLTKYVTRNSTFGNKKGSAK